MPQIVNRKRTIHPGDCPPRVCHFVNRVCAICGLRPGKHRAEIGNEWLALDAPPPASVKLCRECFNVLPDLKARHGLLELLAIVHRR